MGKNFCGFHGFEKIIHENKGIYINICKTTKILIHEKNSLHDLGLNISGLSIEVVLFMRWS